MAGIFPPLAISLLLVTVSFAQQPREPIIDMHLHASSPDGSSVCAPVDFFPAWDAKIVPDFNSVQSFPCADPINAPATAEEVMRQTLSIVKELNITAVTSGPPALLDQWKTAGRERILPATDFKWKDTHDRRTSKLDQKWTDRCAGRNRHSISRHRGKLPRT